ncbi:hypothetical protein ACNUI4_32390 [Pseudomonas aeruginosa]
MLALALLLVLLRLLPQLPRQWLLEFLRQPSRASRTGGIDNTPEGEYLAA